MDRTTRAGRGGEVERGDVQDVQDDEYPKTFTTQASFHDVGLAQITTKIPYGTVKKKGPYILAKAPAHIDVTTTYFYVQNLAKNVKAPIVQPKQKKRPAPHTVSRCCYFNISVSCHKASRASSNRQLRGWYETYISTAKCQYPSTPC